MASRPSRLRLAVLRPGQVGWFPVIGLWLAMTFLLTAGLGLILTSSLNSGAGRIVAIVIGSVLTLLGLACLDPLLTGGGRRVTPLADDRGIRLGSPTFPDAVTVNWDDVLGVGCNQLWSTRRGPVVSVRRSIELFTSPTLDCDPAVATSTTATPPNPGWPDHRLTCTAVDVAALNLFSAQVQQHRPDLWLGDLEEWGAPESSDWADGERAQ